MYIYKITRRLLSCLLTAMAAVIVQTACTEGLSTEEQRNLENFKNRTPMDSVGDLAQLKLVDYAYKGTATSYEEKLELEEALLSGQSPISYSITTVSERDTVVTKTDTIITEKRYPQFEILPIVELLKTGKMTADSLSSLKQRVTQGLLNDQEPIRYVDLDWCYKGKMYRSIGVISNIYTPQGEKSFYLADLMIMGLKTGGCTITKIIKKQQGMNPL